MNVKKLFDLTGRVAIISGGSMGLGLQMAIGLAGNGEIGALRPQEGTVRASGGRVARLRSGDAGSGMRCKREGDDRSGSRGNARKIRAHRYFNQQRGRNVGRSGGRNDAGAVEQSSGDESDGHVFVLPGGGQGDDGAEVRGKIINIASVAGLGGASAELQVIGYHASKGGVIAFTQGSGVQVGTA